LIPRKFNPKESKITTKTKNKTKTKQKKPPENKFLIHGLNGMEAKKQA